MSMAMEIRRKIENRLPEALDRHGLIALHRGDGSSVALTCDLVCEVTHVEGTDRDGNWVEVPYDDINDVGIAVK
jgi:hypothetical protein